MYALSDVYAFRIAQLIGPAHVGLIYGFVKRTSLALPPSWDGTRAGFIGPMWGVVTVIVRANTAT